MSQQIYLLIAYSNRNSYTLYYIILFMYLLIAYSNRILYTLYFAVNAHYGVFAVDSKLIYPCLCKGSDGRQKLKEQRLLFFDEIAPANIIDFLSEYLCTQSHLIVLPIYLPCTQTANASHLRQQMHIPNFLLCVRLF